MRRVVPFDARLYRAALCLYPPAFRREFAPEMLRDFGEARDERTHALWGFWRQMSTDLIKSIVRQWLRTGWPLVTLLSVIGPVISMIVLASLWRPTIYRLPMSPSDADVVAFELLVTAVFLVIAATIIFTVAVPRRPLPRQRR